MHVDIGNNQIRHNFRSIVSSAEIRDLNERVQHEHAAAASSLDGAGPASPQRRVDPNAGIPATTARAGAPSKTLPNSTTPHSRSARSNSADEPPVFAQLPPVSAVPASSQGVSQAPGVNGHHLTSTNNRLSSSSQRQHHHRRLSTSTNTPPPQVSQQLSMAAVASSSHRPGGGSSGWPGAAGSVHGDRNSNAGDVGRASNVSKLMVDGSRHVENDDEAGVAAGSNDGRNVNNGDAGSNNGNKAPQPAGPKLAQTKIQVGMRLRRWIIVNRIGAGSFGETFTAIEVDGPIAEEDSLVVTQENLDFIHHLPPLEQRSEVCIKVEQENKNVLRLEALALKKVQPCPQVVRYLGSGCTNGMNYLVMEKLGSNLAELRRCSQHGTFNIYTTLKAGISCLTAIRGVHDLGLVHRDIKPSNFVTGLPNTTEFTTCYLIDFGLARRFRRSNGEIRPPRDNAGFRGTSRYASVASHHHQELGRVDDLWSLLFMLVEFATGTLPWRKYKDKDDIGRCKEESLTPHLVRNLPREFQPFLAHLQTLRYEDEPDYDLLLTLMHRALERRGYPPNKPVEWELDPSMMDSGMDADGHEGGGAAVERPAAPAPAPVAASSLPPPLRGPAVSPGSFDGVPAGSAHQHAANGSAGGADNNNDANASMPGQPSRRAASQQANQGDTGSRRLLPGNMAAAATGAGTRPASNGVVELVNGHPQQQQLGTPNHPSSPTLRVSDVDVVGANAGRAAATAGSASKGNVSAGVSPLYPAKSRARAAGTTEEPGGVSGVPVEGSETPAVQGSSENDDDFDPNEFSPREMATPANGDRQNEYANYSRPASPAPPQLVSPTAALAASGPSNMLPSQNAAEPSSSNQWRNGADRRSSHGGVLPLPPHAITADGRGEAENALNKVGNATVPRPGSIAVHDLDAAENGEARQVEKDAKKEKHKKKSNCECAIM